MCLGEKGQQGNALSRLRLELPILGKRQLYGQETIAGDGPAIGSLQVLGHLHPAQAGRLERQP